MNEVVKLLVDALMNDVRFSSIINNRFSALFAKEVTPTPYCVYNIPEAIVAETKDSRMFTLSIALYFAADKFTELISFTDVVIEVLKESSFMFQEVSIGYDNVYNEINATIIVKILEY